MKVFCSLLLVFLVLVGLPKPALAHVVETNYLLSPQAQFEVQAKYNTGEPFPHAPVQVYAPNDNSKPWMEGKTDEKGYFAFLPDRTLPGDWIVKLGEVGTDHGDILTVPVTDQGVQIDRVSESPQPKRGSQLVVLGFIAGSGFLGTRFAARKRLL